MEKDTKKETPNTEIETSEKKAVERVAPLTRSHKMRSNLLAIGGFITLLILVAGIFIYVAKGSLAQIQVGSKLVKANISQPQLEKQINESAKNYKITLEYTDGSNKAYPLSETGVEVDAKASAKSAKDIIDKNILQKLAWWRPIKVPLKIKTDLAKFKEFIDTKATDVKVPPKDAAIIVKDGVASITSEEKGTGNIVPNAPHTITEAVASLSTAPLKLKPSTLHPSIAANNLKPSETKVNDLLNQKVTFNVASRNITATPSDIASWLEVTPVKYDKTVDVNVDSGKIEKYIDKIAKPYIQPPRSRLITKVADGYVVLDHGSDGVDVVNKNQTATEVAKKLTDGKGVAVNLSIKYAAAKTVEAAASDKWLVVDVTTKRMYAYEKTNLVKTFLVSAGAPKTPTVTGKFAIYSKLRSQDMRGLNADGSRYFQPDVPYVNYFYKDYAIHGNYWRPTSYFGNVNSSHGCVGIVNSDASWLYTWAPIGTPVIVHS